MSIRCTFETKKKEEEIKRSEFIEKPLIIVNIYFNSSLLITYIYIYIGFDY